MRIVTSTAVYFHPVLPITQSVLNAQEVVIAKKKKDSGSVQVTGDFDSEWLGDIFDDLDSEEIPLNFAVQDVLQERLM